MICGAIRLILVLSTWSLGAGLPLPPKDDVNSSQTIYVQQIIRGCANLSVNFVENDPFVTENVHFFLYTREHWKPYRLTKNDTEQLKYSTFNSSRPTKVLCHGFMNSFQSSMEQKIMNAYLYNQDVNVVAASWALLAVHLLHYNRVVTYTKAVGHEIASLIDFLVSEGGADISSFHLIGHSLGAHILSFASNYVTSGTIRRISGLDPALPEFNCAPAESRLDPSDADWIDCIHTSGGFYGFYFPLCHADFYPNGGTVVQPGCESALLTRACSHVRAFLLFATSINTLFVSQYCETFEMMVMKNCSSTIVGLMGEPSINSLPGIYYLETTAYYPYVKNAT